MISRTKSFSRRAGTLLLVGTVLGSSAAPLWAQTAALLGGALLLGAGVARDASLVALAAGGALLAAALALAADQASAAGRWRRHRRSCR